MKYKPKSYVLPTIYLLFLFVITAGIYFTKKTYDSYEEKEFDNITFVSNSIFDRSIPVINTNDNNTIQKPFNNANVGIARYYYNKDDENEMKEQSIVYYEGTYMPNTGIDYTLNEVFDVLAIYDGTIVDIGNDELLGKTIKIRHNGEIVSVYQGLGSIDVQQGDMVFIGQKIGSSGTNKINKDLGNHLHFEIYKNGGTINPLDCFDKNIGDI